MHDIVEFLMLEADKLLHITEIAGGILNRGKENDRDS